jgi:L-fuconolactonase
MTAAPDTAPVVEEPIETDLPIIDAHHHLWPKDNWLQYDAQDYRRDIASGHNVIASVFAECRASYDLEADPALQAVGETRYVVADTAQPKSVSPRLAAGIVGWADLRRPSDAARTLDAHLEAGKGRFRGVRHNVLWHTQEAMVGQRQFPRHLLMDEEFRRGMAEVGKRGLTYDVWMFSEQLPELASAAAALPDLRIILDHCGGPVTPTTTEAARAEVFAQWRSVLPEVARRPNVAIKLGGLGMPQFGFAFSRRNPKPTSLELAEAWRPYIEFAIETFGTERCMFESNFPVDRGSGSYLQIWNAFKHITRSMSPAEKARLYGGTAQEIYRLEL